MPQKTGVGVTEEKTAAAKAAPQKDKKTARSASAKPDGYGDESITSLKGADRVPSVRASYSARTGWRGASIPSLKSCPTPWTRRVRDTDRS